MDYPLMGGTSDTLSATATEYFHPFHSSNIPSFITTTAQQAFQVMPESGSGHTLDVVLDTAPGAASSGITRRFEVRKNGSLTGCYVEISEDATTGTPTGTFTYEAFDYLEIISTVTGGSAATTGFVYSLILTTSSSKRSYWLASPAGGYAPSTSNRYMFPLMPASSETTQDEVQMLIPVAGTAKSIHILSLGDLNADVTVTLQKATAGWGTPTDTALTVTLADGDLEASASTDVSFSAGNVACLEIISDSTGTTQRIAVTVTYDADTNGEFCYSAATTSSPNQTLTEFMYIGGNELPNTTTRGDHQVLAAGGVSTARIYLDRETAPGSTHSVKFTLEDDSVNTALTDTLTGTDTVSNASATVVIADGSKINIEHDPTGSPAASSVLWAIGFVVDTFGLVNTVQMSAGAKVNTVEDPAKVNTVTLN